MPAGREGTITVLCVHQDPGVAAETATALEAARDALVVVTEPSASDAVDRLDADDVDCVISAYKLPDDDGLGLLEAVRNAHGEIPFVLYTDAGSEAVASEAVTAGVTDYVRRDPDADRTAVLANRIETAVERRRRRATLRRHLDAIETAQEGISILDEDGRFVYVNHAYADLYGYSRTEMIGEHWELVYPDEEVSFTREEILPTVEAEGYWHGESAGERADGSTFVEDHTVARTGGGELVCTVRDVTEQRARERELEAQRRELELKERALDEAPVGITISDAGQADNPLVYANDQFLALTGYGEGDVLGRNCRFLQGEDTDEEPVAELRRAIDAEEPVTVERDGDVALLRIADDGSGLPEEEAMILTGDQEVDPLFHGVGMGLWFVYWIVTLSDGTVSVSVDDGTTIEVTLPLAGDGPGAEGAFE
jgi:PAS domain S-box-containing protein